MTPQPFELVPATDLAASATYLASSLTVTLHIDGPAEDAIAFAATLNRAPGAACPRAESVAAYLAAYLAAERAKTARGARTRGQRLFHIPLPRTDSLVEFASDFALELRRDWPTLSAVMIGTPHRRYPSHQVLVVGGGTHSYTENGAQSNETLVLVTDQDAPMGLLRDGRWYDADECDFDGAAEFLDTYLNGEGAGETAYIALLGPGTLPKESFTALEITLEQWGERLWAATDPW